VTTGRREADEHRQDDDLPRIGIPATRALAGIGVTRLSQLIEHTEDELLALHGFGPRALRIIQDALSSRGLKLRS
jgi:DNA-directed RNA polymerase alpha subunit